MVVELNRLNGTLGEATVNVAKIDGDRIVFVQSKQRTLQSVP